MARVRVHPACRLPVDECICFEGDDDSPARLRRAIREADEGKVTPWEYDGDESTGEYDG